MRKLIVSIIFALIVFASISVTAFADCGPKYSVTVTVKGVDNSLEYYGEPGGTYYATLLSRGKATGPAFAFIEDEHTDEETAAMHEDEIWSAFQNYRDEDGYYYLQDHWELTGDDTFCWGYYPPNEFKILLYFPETGRYLVSEPLERYAFNAYYTANIRDGALDVSAGKGAADFFAELVALLLRIAITIGLELLVALWFGYRRKKEIRVILVTNIVTQVILNAVLNIANFKGGILTAAFFYILLELAIFIAEAIVYMKVLPKATERRTGEVRAGLYALAANFTSFVLGGMLTMFLFSISDVFMYV
ncbi:MAG: hypothetical protein K2O14_02870 [Oscillospiraceae bacterium]|nr:hypothetical protein [Oscillospiraceae bacterium]